MVSGRTSVGAYRLPRKHSVGLFDRVGNCGDRADRSHADDHAKQDALARSRPKVTAGLKEVGGTISKCKPTPQELRIKSKAENKMSRSITIILALLSLLAAPTGLEAEEQPELPPLSSLVSGCTIEKAALGPLVPVGRKDGLWLNCQQMRVLIVHPDNLLTKVNIRTPQQALEFVRFFSSIRTFDLLHTRGCVEIMGEPSSGLFYEVAPAAFKRRLRPAESDPQGSGDANAPADFVVSRTVVCADQGIYHLTAQLSASGMYFELSRKRLLKRADSIGIVHVSAH